MVVGCCWSCAQLRHKSVWFLGLVGFSAPQEPIADTGIQVYCTEKHQVLLKIRLA